MTNEEAGVAGAAGRRLDEANGDADGVDPMLPPNMDDAIVVTATSGFDPAFSPNGSAGLAAGCPNVNIGTFCSAGFAPKTGIVLSVFDDGAPKVKAANTGAAEVDGAGAGAAFGLGASQAAHLFLSAELVIMQTEQVHDPGAGAANLNC